MAINEVTSHLSLPLPHPDNLLEADVLRLREALTLLDGDAATTATAVGDVRAAAATAHTAATTAQHTADAAGQAAQEARTAADAAQGTADRGVAAAATAQNTADTAHTAAINAGNAADGKVSKTLNDATGVLPLAHGGTGATDAAAARAALGIAAGSVTTAGLVQLNNTVTSTATNQAATANAVKIAYDRAVAAVSRAPMPQTSTGVGQFIALSNKGSSVTVPPGGTWVVLLWDDEHGLAAQGSNGQKIIHAGGTVLAYSGWLRLVAWCWRIA